MKNQIESRIEDAIIVFGRFLRQAGCQIGSGEIMLAISASSYIEIANREDFRQTLKSCFITYHKQLILFDQLFDIFWRNPDKIEKVSNILKKLHESRFSQEMAKSMRETIEDMYQKREDGVSKKNGNESNEEKSFNIFLYSPNELLKRKSVVCSTRIEPPIHPNAGEKNLEDFGMWPDDFKHSEFNDYVTARLEDDKITNGIFAPWMMYKDEFLKIGGHDYMFRSAREDSAVFNRLS